MSERELCEIKYELEDLKDASEKLRKRLTKVIVELKELKIKMKKNESKQFESNEGLLMNQ